MDEQPSQFPETPSGKKFRFPTRLTALARRDWYRYVVILFLIFIVVMAALAVMQKLDPRARQAADDQAQYDAYMQREQELINALKNDTAGGKTPEETLQLFLAALKTGDMNEAGQYFALDTNEMSPYYLTRQQWIDALRQKQEQGKIPNVITGIEKARMIPSGAIGSAAFNTENSFQIVMQLNTYNDVWKITSL